METEPFATPNRMADTRELSPGSFRVWWIPQVMGKSFKVPVTGIEEAAMIMAVLAEYDLFQFENRIKRRQRPRLAASCSACKPRGGREGRGISPSLQSLRDLRGREFLVSFGHVVGTRSLKPTSAAK